MKGNTPGLVLLGLTLVSAIITAWLCVATLSAMGTQQFMQEQRQKVLDFRQASRALIDESVLYGRKNPAILTILKQAGIEPTPQAITNTTRANGK